MSIERTGISDLVVARMGDTLLKPVERPADAIGIGGIVHSKLWAPDGSLKDYQYGYNLVTDYGDEMIGERIRLTGDIITGMRLGTGATAAAKNGAGAAIVTYITTSEEALDSAASGADKGAGAGWRITYVSTWIAGDITNSAIAEVVITDENPLTNVAGVVGDTVARFVFAATIDKQAGDSLEVTWQLDVLGA